MSGPDRDVGARRLRERERSYDVCLGKLDGERRDGLRSGPTEPRRTLDTLRPDLTTTLVGLSTLEQLEHAAQSAKKGPLPAEALKFISTIQQGFLGEAR